MNIYARLEDSKVVELFSTTENITGLFHPDFIWVVADSSVKVGEYFEDGIFKTKVDVESLTALERMWRDGELSRADIELNKVQDGDSSAFGSVSDWRAYRKALRGLPDEEGFPINHVRPKAPDVK